MNIAEIQEILEHVEHMLKSAGSTKPLTELTAFRECLEPYRAMTARQFATAINKLNEPAKTPARASKAAAPDVGSLIREVQELYARATDPTSTAERIEETMQRLERLTKAGLVQVAAAIEIGGMGAKTKPVIVGAIRERILGRRGAGQRVNMIDRIPV